VIERYEVRGKPVSNKWLTLGVIGSEHGGVGAHGSIDLIGRGPWVIGVSGTVTGSGGEGHGDRGDASTGGERGHGPATGGNALVYLGIGSSVGGFTLRAELGVGVGTQGRTEARGGSQPDTIARTMTGGTQNDQPTDMGDRHHERVAPVAQASLLIGHALGDRWGISVGPVITSTKLDSALRDHAQAPVDVSLFAGLRYRL
jgi:hypothetical protein